MANKDMSQGTVSKRFWEKVNKAGPIHKTLRTRCWLWTAFKGSEGYGQFSLNKRTSISHRVSWVMVNGPVPEGLSVLHKCDNPSCVNPNHLFLGTQQDNINDRNQKGRTAKGDRSGSRLHPDRVARGDRHGSVTKPESLLRGAKHWTKIKPEKIIKGEVHPSAKLTESEVLEILTLYKKIKKKRGLTSYLADKFGVTPGHITDIIKGRSWKHLQR